MRTGGEDKKQPSCWWPQSSLGVLEEPSCCTGNWPAFRPRLPNSAISTTANARRGKAPVAIHTQLSSVTQTFTRAQLGEKHQQRPVGGALAGRIGPAEPPRRHAQPRASGRSRPKPRPLPRSLAAGGAEGTCRCPVKPTPHSSRALLPQSTAAAPRLTGRTGCRQGEPLCCH